MEGEKRVPGEARTLDFRIISTTFYPIKLQGPTRVVTLLTTCLPAAHIPRHARSLAPNPLMLVLLVLSRLAQFGQADKQLQRVKHRRCPFPLLAPLYLSTSLPPSFPPSLPTSLPMQSHTHTLKMVWCGPVRYVAVRCGAVRCGARVHHQRGEAALERRTYNAEVKSSSLSRDTLLPSLPPAIPVNPALTTILPPSLPYFLQLPPCLSASQIVQVSAVAQHHKGIVSTQDSESCDSSLNLGANPTHHLTNPPFLSPIAPAALLCLPFPHAPAPPPPLFQSCPTCLAHLPTAFRFSLLSPPPSPPLPFLAALPYPVLPCLCSALTPSPIRLCEHASGAVEVRSARHAVCRVSLSLLPYFFAGTARA
ncbi:unnamed protein product [Taenia asiatica]|uniref:Vegetative cell wall protein gp1-like n=1 Tax=Taenia asiatica TaxID=60517 RepID=A0A0R3VXT8_TAEAS|nr:unnamed protein product [Taenia asiatica]